MLYLVCVRRGYAGSLSIDSSRSIPSMSTFASLVTLIPLDYT